MKYGHVGQHFREYWHSVMGRGPRATGNAAPACPVFVVNLERARHRREYILRHLATFGIEPRLFPAVDGSTLDLADLAQRNIYVDSAARKTFSRSLRPAEIACSLSHVNIYRTIVDENIGQALVLEDDAMLLPDFNCLLASALAEIPADWELLQLFHNCPEQVAIGKHVVRFPGTSRLPVGSAAYVIRQSGARKMLEHALPISYPADSLVGRSRLWGIVLYGFGRSAVTQNTIFATDIYQHSSVGSRIIQGVKRLLTSCISTLARVRRTL